MEQKTQPVLCCLCGDEYSDPTQFVMERLFASANLDWKVITAQIQSDSVGEAIAGIQALNLSAIRFGQPFDAAGQHDFLSENPDISFVGAVSAAADEAEGWNGWHSFGHAFVELMSTSVDWASCTILLDGDSVHQRSTILALAKKPPASILWLSAGAAEDAFENWLEQSGQSLDDSVSFVAAHQLSESLESSLVASEQLAVIQPSRHTFDVLAASQSEEWDKIVAWDPNQMVPQEFSGLASFHAISQTNLSIAIDEYDFRRWTKADPNRSLLVDAHEEYCSF